MRPPASPARPSALPSAFAPPSASAFAFASALAFALAAPSAQAGGPAKKTEDPVKPAVNATAPPSTNPSTTANANAEAKAKADAKAAAQPDAQAQATRSPPYPVTRKAPVTDTLHGTALTDDYRWLEDAKSPEVQAWMDAQGRAARVALDALPGRAAFKARLHELVYLDSVGVPLRRGERLFYGERKKSQEKEVLWVRPVKGGKARVVLDPNGFSTDGTVALGGWSPSWDGKLIAYQVKPNNSDTARLEVREVDTGHVLPLDTIAGGRYAQASWTPDGKGFYYTWFPTDESIPVAERPGHTEIRFHALRTDPKTDRLVRGATHDPTRFQTVDLSQDGRWLLLYVQHGWTKNDCYAMDLAAPEAERKFKPVFVGNDGLFGGTVFRDKLYATTTWGSPKGRVVRVDLTAKDPSELGATQLLLAERATHALGAVTLVGGRLAVQALVDASDRLELYDLVGKKQGDIALPGLGSTSAVSGLPDAPAAYFSFESYTHPREIRELAVKQGTSKVTFKLAAPVQPEKFEVRQLFGKSKDGTRIPVFVVARKGQKPSGDAPTILYGYGGFSQSITPTFSATLYAWLEQGGVYASAVLRGGAELGEDWHRAGMRERKQNVFDDFFAAADALVQAGITSPKHLVALGGSNGGLLVGAALTQRPELWAGILCAVPLLDMVRYDKFGSGKTWVSEYGSADDAEQFKTLLAYSPYQHVTDGTVYPPTLLLSADADDRVDPMHARKLAARLQAASKGGPVWLRIEKHAGHGGADRRKETVEKLADEYAFAWDVAAGGAK